MMWVALIVGILLCANSAYVLRKGFTMNRAYRAMMRNNGIDNAPLPAAAVIVPTIHSLLLIVGVALIIWGLTR